MESTAESVRDGPARGVLTAPDPGDLAAVVAEFEKVLGRPVGDSDDFFSLGGTSFLAVRVVAGLTARSGRMLTLVDLLRLRTPAAIASHLRGAPEVPGRTLPPPTGERHELSPPQRWYSTVYRGRLAPTAVMSFAVELPDGTDPAAVAGALTALADRHDALRTTVLDVDGRLVQRVREAGDPADGRSRPTVREVAGGREEVARATAEALADGAAAGIPLDGGPLHRAVVVRGTEPAAARPARLGIVIHHLVFDGGSVPVVTRELLALLADPATRLPAPTSYRAYTSWRLDRESPERVAAERRWWGERLAGLESRCHLPVRPGRDRYAGYATSLTLPAPVSEEVAGAARRHLVPVSAVRLAAYAVLGHALYGTPDMVVALPVAVRDHPALRDAVGMFVNMVLVRHRARPGESVRELVADVAAGLTDAVDHREHGFDHVMAALPERCQPGRFPITGAVANGTELDAPDGPPATAPTTVGLPRCNVCDVQVFFVDAPGRVDLELQHRADLLRPEEGRRLLECYVDALTAVARADDDHAVETLVAAAAAALAERVHGAGQ